VGLHAHDPLAEPIPQPKEPALNDDLVISLTGPRL